MRTEAEVRERVEKETRFPELAVLSWVLEDSESKEIKELFGTLKIMDFDLAGKLNELIRAVNKLQGKQKEQT